MSVVGSVFERKVGVLGVVGGGFRCRGVGGI